MTTSRRLRRGKRKRAATAAWRETRLVSKLAQVPREGWLCLGAHAFDAARSALRPTVRWRRTSWPRAWPDAVRARRARGEMFGIPILLPCTRGCRDRARLSRIPSRVNAAPSPRHPGRWQDRGLPKPVAWPLLPSLALKRVPNTAPTLPAGKPRHHSLQPLPAYRPPGRYLHQAAST